MVSPLVKSADSVLIARSDMASIVDSLVAPLSPVSYTHLSVDDFNLLLRAGADKVSVNSAAVHRPELISEADVYKRQFKILVRGFFNGSADFINILIQHAV